MKGGALMYGFCDPDYTMWFYCPYCKVTHVHGPKEMSPYPAKCTTGPLVGKAYGIWPVYSYGV